EIIRLGKLASELTLGVDLKRITSDYENQEKTIKEILTKDKSILKKRFKEYLEGIIDVKIVVFLDDIDRCSPFFAIKILEELKSYFKIVENLIFVIAYDREQLESIIRKKFGSDMDTNGYLIKFFDTNYLFSNTNKKDFLDRTKDYCIQYLDMEDNDIVDLIFKTIHSYTIQLELNTLRTLQQAIYRLVFGLKRVLHKNPDIQINKEMSHTLVVLMFLREKNWKLYADLYKNRIDGLDVCFEIAGDKNFQGIVEDIYVFRYLLLCSLQSDQDNFVELVENNINRCTVYESTMDFNGLHYVKGSFSIVLKDFLEKRVNYGIPNRIVKQCLDILEYD
nr:KAP family NTPase [Campylobacterota bacterium]